MPDVFGERFLMKYKDNPAYFKEASRRSKLKNRDKYLIKNKQYRLVIRSKLIKLIGGFRCIKCGFTDKRALQIIIYMTYLRGVK